MIPLLQITLLCLIIFCLQQNTSGDNDMLLNKCPTWQYFQPVSPRIYGGDIAPRSVPWQAALYYRGHFKCGGIIIDQTTVLTAAHCLIAGEFYLDLDPQAYSVAFGIRDETMVPEVGIIPERIIKHPKFSVVQKLSEADIAIVKLPWKQRISYGFNLKALHVK